MWEDLFGRGEAQKHMTMTKVCVTDGWNEGIEPGSCALCTAPACPSCQLLKACTKNIAFICLSYRILLALDVIWLCQSLIKPSLPAASRSWLCPVCQPASRHKGWQEDFGASRCCVRSLQSSLCMHHPTGIQKYLFTSTFWLKMRECGAFLLAKGQGMVSVNPDGRAKTVIIQCSETCIALAHVVLYITLHFYFLCSLGCSCGHVLGLAHRVTLQEPRWAVTKHPALAMVRASEPCKELQAKDLCQSFLNLRSSHIKLTPCYHFIQAIHV